MTVTPALDPLIGQTTCGSLLRELQLIWDDVGEGDEERDKMLLQLEQECLDVYKRKVNQAARSREQLLQSLSESRSELVRLISSLGESGVTRIHDKSPGTIKEKLAAIAPVLEQLCKKKEERIMEFVDVISQIQKIHGEIEGVLKTEKLVVDEEDLSLKKLDEIRFQLQELQKEKSDRLHKVLDLVSTVHDLCAVLGMDFNSIVTEVHPSLVDSAGMQSKSISNDTLSKLFEIVDTLKEGKTSRLQKLQDSAAQLTELWNLMDTSMEERSLFNHVTCNISATVDEVTVPGALAIDLIAQAEAEVERLDQLKFSKMKEIALKKQSELEVIYARAHIEIDSETAQEKLMALVDSGNVEPSELLVDMDNQILKAKEEAQSRKDILERVEKWMSACEEESWLDDYSRDDNRYSSSRGAHINLKRAEKARVLVNKIPVLVDTLVTKTQAWEADRGMSFSYDGVSLLAMLHEYTILRHDREEEKRRLRDQKKFQEQQSTEQEAIFGSKPSPARSMSTKKVVGPRGNAPGSNVTPGRRLTITPHGNNSVTRTASRDGKRDHQRPAVPINYVAIAKDDAASNVSACETISASP